MPDLSSAQFGQSRSLTEFAPTPHGVQAGVSNPQYYSDVEPPLALSSKTNTSAKQAAAWRKPHKVLSYSTATQSSVFSPFGDS